MGEYIKANPRADTEKGFWDTDCQGLSPVRGSGGILPWKIFEIMCDPWKWDFET